LSLNRPRIEELLILNGPGIEEALILNWPGIEAVLILNWPGIKCLLILITITSTILTIYWNVLIKMTRNALVKYR